MSGVVSILVGIVTDPVYGLPLLLFGALGVLWLYVGQGFYPPVLRPYGVATVRPTDPVSSMYWALREQRYSHAIYFAYLRVAAAFRRRYGVGISDIPWSARKRARLGLDEPAPFHRMLREMNRAIDLATVLERPPRFRAWAALRRTARERTLQARLERIFDTLDWMVPMLEGSS